MLKVELLLALDDAYGRAVARGVVRFAKARSDWKLYGRTRLLSGGEKAGLSEEERRCPDGIIARAESPQEARYLAGLGIPVVDVAGAYPLPVLREVTNDDDLTGRKAGEYLKTLGFKRFAFCGVAGAAWSSKRLRGFESAIPFPNGRAPRFERSLIWWKERGREEMELGLWLRALPTPTALFACNDLVGLKVAEICHALGIAVPLDIAILGVDDEDLLCELADPSLSSIRLNCEGIGNAAAELLDALMRRATGNTGEPPGRHLVAPGSVVERESSRILVSEDPLVARAATWIRANAHLGAQVTDLLAELPISRRAMEIRFKNETGKTLRAAIEDARLDRAKRLLEATDLPLDSIAESCGFGSLQRFHLVFKNRQGTTPGLWRKKK